MNLQLGFFEDFKSKDSVLLVGSPSDMNILAVLLGNFTSSQETSLAIHNFASVAPNQPAQLFVQRSARGLPTGQTQQFNWLCSADEYPTIRAKLERLAESCEGHQYFSLIGSHAQLMVSVGEYSQSWCQAHG